MSELDKTAIENLKLLNDLNDNLKEANKEDIFVIEESIKRIKTFVEALQNIQNPEFEGYALDNKMLKMD